LLAKTLLDPVQDGSQLDERAEILCCIEPELTPFGSVALFRAHDHLLLSPEKSD